MSRPMALVLVATTIASLGCVENVATCHADRALLLSYMERRVASFSSSNQQVLGEQTGTSPTEHGVTLVEAKAFLDRASAPVSGWVRGCARLIDSSPEGVLNGWSLKQSAVLVASAEMSAGTSGPVLFCVLDGQRIYELSNENGFQLAAAKEWLSVTGQLPSAEKSKVIAEAFAVSAGGGVIGYVSDVKDIRRVLDLCRTRDIGLGDQDTQWFQLEEQYYALHPSQIGGQCAFFVVWHPFLSLRRLCFSATEVVVEVENPGTPGSWVSPGGSAVNPNR